MGMRNPPLPPPNHLMTVPFVLLCQLQRCSSSQCQQQRSTPVVHEHHGSSSTIPLHCMCGPLPLLLPPVTRVLVLLASPPHHCCWTKEHAAAVIIMLSRFDFVQKRATSFNNCCRSLEIPQQAPGPSKRWSHDGEAQRKVQQAREACIRPEQPQRRPRGGYCSWLGAGTDGANNWTSTAAVVGTAAVLARAYIRRGPLFRLYGMVL